MGRISGSRGSSMERAERREAIKGRAGGKANRLCGVMSTSCPRRGWSGHAVGIYLGWIVCGVGCGKKSLSIWLRPDHRRSQTLETGSH